MRGVLLVAVLALLASPGAAASTSAHTIVHSPLDASWSGSLSMDATEIAAIVTPSASGFVAHADRLDVEVVRVATDVAEAPIGDVAYAPQFENESLSFQDADVYFVPSANGTTYAHVRGAYALDVASPVLSSLPQLGNSGDFSYLMNYSSRLFFRDELPHNATILGNSQRQGPHAGLAGTGDGILFLAEGDLTIKSSAGTFARHLALEHTRKADGPLGALAPARRDTYSFVRAHGRGITLSPQIAQAWAAASTTRFDGTIKFSEATGSSRVGAVTYALHGQSLELQGIGSLQTRSIGTALREYDVQGDFSSLSFFDGRVVVTDAQQATIVVLLAAFALAFTKLGRQAIASMLAAFYTRIDSRNILDNPERVRLYELIQAKPGMHMRELQRALQLGWGKFHYHFGVLQRTGLISVQSRGKHDFVFLRTQAAPSQSAFLAPRGEAARVFAALAEGPRTQRQLSEELALSRQLVAHHLTSLEAEGLVTSLDGRPRRFMRTAAAMPPEEAVTA